MATPEAVTKLAAGNSEYTGWDKGVLLILLLLMVDVDGGTGLGNW